MSNDARKMICLVLATALVMGPPAIYAQQPADAPSKIDLSYVTPETTVTVVAHPRRVLAAPEMEMLPIEVISAASKKELGIDPLEVEQIMAIAEPPVAGPPQAAVIIKFSKPQKMGEMLPPISQIADRSEINGRVYLKGRGPEAFSLYAVDRQTLIVANDGLLRKLLAQGEPAAGPMNKLLADVGDPPDLMVAVVVDPVRPLVEQMLPGVPVPHPFEPLKKLPGLLSSVEMKTDLTGQPSFSLALQAQDAAAADEVERIVDRMLALAQQTIEAQIAEQAASDDPIEQATAQYVKRINKRIISSVRPKRDDTRFELAASGEGQMQVAVIGVLVALLLPAVNATRTAARRNQSQVNLRMIGQGIHAYYAEHGRLPANIVDENGKPLLSWRVRLLPYLEEHHLQDRFKLDEPWDSEHNRQFILDIPVVYRNPSNNLAQSGKTNYIGLDGPGTVFGTEKGLLFEDVRDGTSKTVAVVEANQDRGVIWSAPSDLPFDPNEPLAGLGEAQVQGFLVLMLDASTRFVVADINPNVFKAAATYGGNEAFGGF